MAYFTIKYAIVFYVQNKRKYQAFRKYYFINSIQPIALKKRVKKT